MSEVADPEQVVRGKRGRKMAKLPPDVLERLGPPPTGDPIAMAAWAHKLCGELAWLECQGKCPQALGARIRATVGAMVRSVPDAIRAELDARLRGDAPGSAERTGPAPESVTSGPAAVRG